MAPEQLPTTPVTRLTAPFLRFMAMQTAGGAILVVATLTALVLANTSLADDMARFWRRPFTIALGDASLSYPLWYWINDGLMTIFFFVIGLEIKRELTWGELRDRRNLVLPIVSALGGAVVPVGLYLVLQPSAPGNAGWAVPMATDIAFVVGCLAVLGSRVPPALKVFMLSLAIIDDLLAVIVIAVAFSASIDLVALAAAVGGLAVVFGLDRIGVRRIGVYVLVGAVIWLCTLKSGIHPTIAGVLLGLLTPAAAWIRDDRLLEIVDQATEKLRRAEGPRTADHHEAAALLAQAATESISPLERLEHALHAWVVFAIIPVFALANAGVPISAEGLASPVAIAVILGLAVGKPVGIAGAALIAVKLGLAPRPERTSWSALLGAAWLGGIGFTMALFIASLSVAPTLLDATKTGILIGSGISLVAGMTVLGLSLRTTPPRA